MRSARARLRLASARLIQGFFQHITICSAGCCVRYGWRDFLWFSDIALVATVVALWLESAYAVVRPHNENDQLGLRRRSKAGVLSLSY